MPNNVEEKPRKKTFANTFWEYLIAIVVAYPLSSVIGLIIPAIADYSFLIAVLFTLWMAEKAIRRKLSSPNSKP